MSTKKCPNCGRDVFFLTDIEPLICRNGHWLCPLESDNPCKACEDMKKSKTKEDQEKFDDTRVF